jgi:succinate dehydrogenase/fumarate reductase-like Fe-S protein
MGVCHECRVMIDGQRVLACQTLCRDGMRIDTDINPTPTTILVAKA